MPKELTESQQQCYEWIVSALNKWIESDGVREAIIIMLDQLVEELLNENKALDIIFRSKYDEMEYKWEGETKVLLDGYFKTYHFIIASIGGNHPSAYIELEKSHPLYKKSYEDIDFPLDEMPVHGGVTYIEEWLKVANIHNSWVIGWDYGHLGDYCSVPEKYDKYSYDDHKWTVLEILAQDVIPAIQWLKENSFKDRKSKRKNREQHK